ncbi:PQQ-like beta-propeller repeat protein [candidate division WOR-3 bacterium]|nr:PQQ-like beta-propeller repeat protein [candidate division WOR-3 bacterium]
MGGEINSWDTKGDSILIVGNSLGRITMYSLENGSRIFDTTFQSSVSAINCVNGEMVVLFEDGVIKMFDEKFEILQEFKISKGRYMPSFESEYKIFYQKIDGMIYILDVKTLFISEVGITDATGIGMRKPVKSMGKVFFLTREELWCLDENTGNVLWFSPFDETAIPSDFDVFNDTVFVSFCDGSLVSLESFDGRIHDNRKLFLDMGFFFDLSCEDVYYIAENGDLGVYFRVSDGFLWNLKTENLYLVKPLLEGDYVIYASLDGKFIVVDRWTGTSKMTFQMGLSGVKYFENFGKFLFAVGEKGVFCVIGKR